MIILGIDPGFSVTGYSVLKKEAHITTLLDSGALKMSPKKHLAERVYIFHHFFTEKIRVLGITHISLETPFLGKNAQNFLKLGYLRGIVYLLAYEHKLQLSEFSPREIKQAVTGFGGAGKDQVARVIYRLFPRVAPTKTLDITDAVAISLCGLWQKKVQKTPLF